MADDSLEPREFTRTWQVPSLDSREMKSTAVSHSVCIIRCRIGLNLARFFTCASPWIGKKHKTHLTSPLLAKAILDSAKLYEAKMRWHVTLFLLMA